ncbi:MAG TPA: insulinase family protein, partial [Candidatus Ozemobacteraceae bacterium]|nr:insulinase family protein [Candidatus Ozemobacteraceae bacterium]
PPKVIRKEMDINRAHLMLGYRTVPLAKTEDSIGLDVLGVILGFGRSSRLSSELKEKKGLVTSIAAGQTSLTDDGLFLVRAEFDPIDEDAVLDGVKEELRRIVREPVGEEELQKAKDFLENAYLRGVESTTGKAESLGGTLMRTDLEYEFKYLERIRAVTASQLQMLANKYLAGENYVLVLIGPRPRITSAATTEHPVSGKTTKYKLANGMTIVHREIPGSGLVGLTMGVDAGARREPAGKSGISNLTAEMMLKGTKHRDGAKILWDLESLGAELSAGPEPDLVRINLSSSGRNFAKALEIMADVVRNPVFPESAFTVEKNKLLMRLRAIGDDMFENTWRLFLANMYKGHPYGRYHLGEMDDVEKLTVGDLKQYHARAYVPNNMVIAVVGDVNASEAIKLIYTSFGALPPGPVWEEDKTLAEVSGVKEFKDVRDVREKKQAFVCLGWLGPKIGHPDYIKVKILNAILGGGMSARYFMNIRNKQSLAYAVTSLFPSRMFGGALLAAIGTDPGMIDKVRDAVLHESEDIIKNGVSAEELARAIAYETGKFALDHDSCSKNASYLAWFESIGAGYQYDDTYLQEAKTVTAEDVKQMAVKYLGQNRALMAVTGPAVGGKK